MSVEAAGRTPHSIKRVSFLGRRVPVLCQNENGPCPLLAICNVLLLRGTLRLHDDLSYVTAAQLIQLVGNLLLERNNTANLDANRAANVEAAVNVMPRLLVGLEVNVGFTGVTKFEFTEEMVVFDLLGINLYHGWIVDPDDQPAARYIGTTMYNTLVEQIIEYRAAKMEERRSLRVPTAERVLPSSGDGAGAGAGDGAGAGAGAGAGDDTGRREVRDLGGDDGGGDDGIPVASVIISEPDIDPGDAGAAMERKEGSDGPVAAPPQAAVVAATAVVDDDDDDDDDVVAVADVAVVAQPLRVDERPEFAKAKAIDAFLTQSSGQLTYTGLLALHEQCKERELSVFFRNNHFNAMFKINGELYLLVTDLGYSRVPQVVWEKLDEIDGDTTYVNAEFKVPPPAPTATGLAPAPAQTPAVAAQQANADYLLALSLAGGAAPPTQQGGAVAPAAAPTAVVPNNATHGATANGANGAAATDPDLLLALALSQSQAQAQGQGHPQVPASVPVAAPAPAPAPAHVPLGRAVVASRGQGGMTDEQVARAMQQQEYQRARQQAAAAAARQPTAQQQQYIAQLRAAQMAAAGRGPAPAPQATGGAAGGGGGGGGVNAARQPAGTQQPAVQQAGGPTKKKKKKKNCVIM